MRSFITYTPHQILFNNNNNIYLLQLGCNPDYIQECVKDQSTDTSEVEENASRVMVAHTICKT